MNAFTFRLMGLVSLFFFSLPAWSFSLRDVPDYLRLDFIDILPVEMPAVRTRHMEHPTDLLDYSLSEEEIKDLFESIKLDYQGMEGVKEAFEQEDYDVALKELQTYFLERESPVYFSDSLHENRPPPDPEYDTTEAEAVQEHYFNFSGNTGNPGTPIDWDYEADDYIEWNFALNRLYFLYPLIHAYWNTHEGAYADYAVEDLADWMIRGPSQNDRVLEVSIRMATMHDAYFYLRHRELFSSDLHGLYLLRMVEQAEYLKDEDNIPGGGWLSHWWYAALLFSRIFPEFHLSENLLSMAEDIMVDFIDDNYYEDGFARTSSLMYHFFVETPHYIHLSTLYDENDWAVPAKERLYDIFSTYGKAHLPDYELPLFGDSENRGAELLRLYMLKVADLIECEGIRYLGTQGEKGVPPDYTSVEAPWSKLFFLRRDWSEESSFVGLNIGYGEGWHSHYDFLSFVYYMNGKKLLRDSGVHSYEQEDRERFRSSMMHNIPAVENKGQEAQVSFPPEERGEIAFSLLNESFDLVHGTLRYLDEDEKITELTRRYFYLKEKDCLVLVDSFSHLEKEVTQYFQIGAEYEELTPSVGKVEFSGGELQAYLTLHPLPYAMTPYYGSEDPFLGWYCEKFHDIEPAHTLALHYRPPLPPNMIFVFTGDHKRPEEKTILQADKEKGQWGIQLVYEDRTYYMFQTPEIEMKSDFDHFLLDGFYAFLVVENDSIVELVSDGDLYYQDIELQENMYFPPYSEVGDYHSFY